MPVNYSQVLRTASFRITTSIVPSVRNAPSREQMKQERASGTLYAMPKPLIVNE